MTSTDSPYGRLKEVCTRCGKSYREGTGFCPADGAELMSTMSDPLIGVVLPRRYRILSLLGRGSMSVVYKGTYEPLDRFVAIKMLKSHLVSDPHQARRFQQEIKAAGGLSHPNIVGILDFGVTDQGVPYLVMEYLDGQSLGQILETEGRVSVYRTLRLATQMTDALALAHREGIVHRDIKPSNIVICKTPEQQEVIKIADFGIAKIQRAQGETGEEQMQKLTATGEVIGTPLYMSPEQSLGRDLDGRSDIYSLGCLLYHMLTGKPPFLGDTSLDTIRMQISATPAPLNSVRTDLFIPDPVQAIITKAMAKDPRMRYQRMEHMQADLNDCLQRLGTSFSSVRTKSVEPEPIAEEPTGFRLPHFKVKTLFIAVAVITTIGVAVWGITTNVGKQKAKVDIPVASSDAWKTAINRGETAFTAARFGEADEALKDALREAQKFEPPDTRMAQTLNLLSQLYYAQDNLPEAEKACREALSTARAIGPKETAAADALDNLSRIQCANGNYAAAQKNGTEALELRQRLQGPNDYEVALSLQGLAEIECSRGNFARAAEMLTKAQAIARKSLNADAPELASILHNLGMVKERQGKYKEATELFNNALGIRQRQLGTNHPLVSDTMCALATLDFNTRNDAAAERLFKNALEIRQQAYGDNSSKVAEVYSCLAILYDSQRKFQPAEDCYRKAVEIREQIWGAESPRLERSLTNLAKFLRQHGQNNGAEIYEAQVKRIREKSRRT